MHVLQACSLPTLSQYCILFVKGHQQALCQLIHAVGSIRNYQVHAVVANILETRMDQVLIVRTDDEQQPIVDTINRDQGQPFIEKPLDAKITELHSVHLHQAV